MENIAPAVLNGGFSSLLALSLLVTSKSHIFVSFFKIFFMICVFGLFHGLILLPVVLCLVGPVEAEVEKAKQKSGALGGDRDRYLRENQRNLQREEELTLPLAVSPPGGRQPCPRGRDQQQLPGVASRQPTFQHCAKTVKQE